MSWSPIEDGEGLAKALSAYGRRSIEVLGRVLSVDAWGETCRRYGEFWAWCVVRYQVQGGRIEFLVLHATENDVPRCEGDTEDSQRLLLREGLFVGFAEIHARESTIPRLIDALDPRVTRS